MLYYDPPVPTCQSIDAAVLEFSITAPLLVEPDGAFLLEGATVKFRLLERGVDREGKESISELNVTSDRADYRFQVDDNDVATFDDKTSTITAVTEGEISVIYQACTVP